MNINNKLCCAGPDWLITLQINTKINKEQREKKYPKVIKSGKGYSIYRFGKKIKHKAIVIQMKSN